MDGGVNFAFVILTTIIMKNFKILFLILFSILLTPDSVEANEKDYIVSVSKEKLDPTELDPMPNKRRTPSKPITCTISSEGIDIPGVASNDIYLYEVYSEEGECLANFASESDFIAFIFATGQTVEIRLYTDGYLLRGFLYR